MLAPSHAGVAALRCVDVGQVAKKMADGGGRSRLLVVLAFLVSAGLVGGAAVALVKASDDKGSTRAAPTAAPLVTPSPTPSPTPSETPSPVATPTQSATPTATPSATTSTTASPTAKATGAATFYAYPKPTAAYKGLYVTATSSSGEGDTLDTFRLTVDANDGDGAITFGGLTWGDGTSVAAQSVPGSCPPRPSPTTRPGAYQPAADAKHFAYTHQYSAPGSYTINITVNSGNTTCRPHGPASETSTVKLTIKINPVQTASPAP